MRRLLLFAALLLLVLARFALGPQSLDEDREPSAPDRGEVEPEDCERARAMGDGAEAAMKAAGGRSQWATRFAHGVGRRGWLAARHAQCSNED